MAKAVICRFGEDVAVQFAAKELSRYLHLATGQRVPILSPNRPPRGAAVFRLGVCEDVGVRRPDGLEADDDWIRIEPKDGGHVLTGSNPRSVLFAVYRYLHELGFRWIRPGRRGEIVPRLRSTIKRGLCVDERASYRFRTFCIEGAASREHVLDLIDWAAKRAMNGYFVQFEHGSFFFQRWYNDESNPYWKRGPFEPGKARRIVEDAVAATKKRGLRFEQIGHGWTCAALGLPGEGWGTSQRQFTEQQRSWLAELNGQRDLFHGVALNTNLCYGKPEVRAAMTDKIAAYAAAHPQVDAIHFWLADGSNNNCECPECQKARPADFYVDMLNELDGKLSARGLATKIVFLIYVDLLWPPLKSRIRKPNRFVLMFAPITRSYLSSFAEAAKQRAEMAPFVRNKLEFPKDAPANISYLRGWQESFPGPGFDFDYHIIWPCYYDLNHFTLGRVLHKDIQQLGAIGLHGFNSCQNQRASFPTNLLMDLLAETLWNKRATFGNLAQASFTDAFGKDGAAVAAFCEKMSRLWMPFFEAVFTAKRDDARIQEGLRNLPRMAAQLEAFRPIVRRGLQRSAGAVRWSWKYFDAYLRLLDLLLPAVEAYLRCSADTRKKFEAAFDFLLKNEKTLHPAFDVDTYIKVQQWRINEVEAELKRSAGG